MEDRTIRAMNDLDKEIEEMEALLSAPQEEEPTEEAEQPTVQEPTPVIAPDLQQDLEAAQKRFNNYKGSTDKKLFEQRNRIKELESLVSSLQSQITQLSQLPPVDTPSLTSNLSQEDKEVLGESTVNALDKSLNDAIDSKVSAVEAQLEEERKMRKAMEERRQEELAAQRYNAFVAQLSSVVPDYEKIVLIDDFRNRFLKEPDPFSGIQREQLFLAAEDDGDVGRVASFFEEYKKVLNAQDNLLEESITPTGINNDAPPMEKPKFNITPQFIDKFYNDLAKGDRKYKGKKGQALAAETEAAIDEFVMNGGLQ